jgi:hypothetical protein
MPTMLKSVLVITHWQPMLSNNGRVCRILLLDLTVEKSEESKNTSTIQRSRDLSFFLGRELSLMQEL